MKKVVKALKISTISLVSLFLALVLGLAIYTADSYKPLNGMTEEIALLNTEEIMGNLVGMARKKMMV